MGIQSFFKELGFRVGGLGMAILSCFNRVTPDDGE